MCLEVFDLEKVVLNRATQEENGLSLEYPEKGVGWIGPDAGRWICLWGHGVLNSDNLRNIYPFFSCSF
jgi:hypothetical protein